MTAASKSACLLPRGLDRSIRCGAKEGKGKTENLHLRACHSCRAFGPELRRYFPFSVLTFSSIRVKKKTPNPLRCLARSLAGKTGTRLIEHRASAR
ncbi:hypothetical protein H5410_000764 [Solanum commersonii]|uniref:Uncharacterized protein n=1 Tax=Solanum commersonii TaxID=4109 RepID=A0A9J6AY68_SOLCO|nr:hypothetical protein H5410_000764 [Solanum commersonii]